FEGCGRQRDEQRQHHQPEPAHASGARQERAQIRVAVAQQAADHPDRRAMDGERDKGGERQHQDAGDGIGNPRHQIAQIAQAAANTFEHAVTPGSTRPPAGRRPGRSRYCPQSAGLMPICCASLTVAVTSSLKKRSNSATLIGIGSLPVLAIRSPTAATSIALRDSSCSLTTISRGVFTGRKTPVQNRKVESLRPSSVVVGTWGRAIARFSLLTASALSCPCWTSGSAGASGRK